MGRSAAQDPMHHRRPERCGPHPLMTSMNKEKRKRILIVEDNQPCLLLLNDVLAVCGYEILKTTVGLEAINLARANRRDLILAIITLTATLQTSSSSITIRRWRSR
jgi:PleD family two-component response regulator